MATFVTWIQSALLPLFFFFASTTAKVYNQMSTVSKVSNVSKVFKVSNVSKVYSQGPVLECKPVFCQAVGIVDSGRLIEQKCVWDEGYMWDGMGRVVNLWAVLC